MRRAGARIPGALGTAQPLAVQELAAGQVGGSPGAAVQVDSLLVAIFRGWAVAGDQGPGPGQEPECDGAGMGDGQLGQLAGQVLGGVVVTGPLSGLDEIGQSELDLRGVIDAGREAGAGGIVAAVSELEDAAGIVGENELVSLALPFGLLGHCVQQGVGLLTLPAPGRDEQ